MMKYESRIVAFIDVLGFKNTIVGTTQDSSAIDRVVDFIQEVRRDFCISTASIIKHKSMHIPLPDEISTRKVTQFSDSLVISYKEDEISAIFHMLYSLFFLHFSALERSMLIRGCVVCGDLIHTDELLFGPALVEAVEKEKALASYPRIVLDDSIIELGGKYHQHHHELKEEQAYIFSLLNKDFDGLYYINYFTDIEEESDLGYQVLPYHLSKLRSIIADLGKINTPSVYSKYLWLKEKYNHALGHYKAILDPLKSPSDIKETALAVRSFDALK